MVEPIVPEGEKMDVLGENEALQQFFEGQDVTGVLESAEVDTSMLEQYLSNDMDPSTFMLPESPPDSGSEPYSPPQVPDMHCGSSSMCGRADLGGGYLKDRDLPSAPGQPSQHPHLSGLIDTYPTAPSPHDSPYVSPFNGHNQASATPRPPQSMGPANSYNQATTTPRPPQCIDSANGYNQATATPRPPQCIDSANGYNQATATPRPPQCIDPANGYNQATATPRPPQCIDPANGYNQATATPRPPQCIDPANGYNQATATPRPPQCIDPANGYNQATATPRPPQCIDSANGYNQATATPRPPQCIDPANGYNQATATPRPPQCIDPANGYNQATATPSPPHCMGPADSYTQAQTPRTGPSFLIQPSSGCPDRSFPYLPPTPGLQSGPALPDSKKRRRSASMEGATDPRLWGTPAWLRSTFGQEGGVGGDTPSYDSDGQSGSPGQGHYQLLTWDRYQAGQWSELYGGTYQSLAVPGYHVDTDKGFNFSPADEAFVCQKKNHFQVTVHIGLAGNPKYVKTPSGFQPIGCFHLKVFGIKLEAQNHLVTIEQSQSDRSKKPFLPVKVHLPEDQITKVTLGRLHFSETTANNMRKKSKPNPDQRFFLLVVGLYACVGEESFLLVAHVSERIIVRASNPGQFESDSEALWQRGQAPDTAACHGRVGINTDAPDEALVVCGNVKVMGSVMHPSDCRAKHNIQEVDSTEQLRRIAQMRIVEYDYKPEFATKMGIDHVHETGIIAQEVKELLPTAVKDVGDVVCMDGEKIHNFLMVDKEQIFFENVGAVKQLCKLTDNLESRIQELEVWNKRLAVLKRAGSLRSNSSTHSMHRKVSTPNNIPPPQKTSPLQSTRRYLSEKYKLCSARKAFQATIITLVTTMAFCVISITALYLLTLEEDGEAMHGISTATNAPSHTFPSVTSPSNPGLSGTFEVDFCGLLYCEEVYCCPLEPGNQSVAEAAPTRPSPSPDAQPGERMEYLYEIFKDAKDWKNTTIKSIFIQENQHVIDQRYCKEGNCGAGNYSYVVPISKFVPVNMRVTLQMNTTELLVIHLCHSSDAFVCSAVMDYVDSSESFSVSNTQGYVHEWPLPVARLLWGSYHFRATVAGQADCNTDPNYAEALFTDYHFHFYRSCS